MRVTTLTGRPTLVCGHRGDLAHAPENTLVAFRLAADNGAEWVEFDVQLTQDNVPILMHDEAVNRTTDGVGLISALTHAKIASLNAAATFIAREGNFTYGHEPVPDLESVLREIAVERGLGVNIELKGRPGSAPDLGAIAAALVYKYDLLDRVVISSFDHQRLRALRNWFAEDTQHRPALPIGMLYDVRLPDPVALALTMGAQAIHPKAILIDAALVEKAHAQGLAVNTWTVDEKAEMERLMSIGVDMIISNTPGYLRTVRDAFFDGQTGENA